MKLLDDCPNRLWSKGIYKCEINQMKCRKNLTIGECSDADFQNVFDISKL